MNRLWQGLPRFSESRPRRFAASHPIECYMTFLGCMTNRENARANLAAVLRCYDPKWEARRHKRGTTIERYQL